MPNPPIDDKQVLTHAALKAMQVRVVRWFAVVFVLQAMGIVMLLTGL